MLYFSQFFFSFGLTDIIFTADTFCMVVHTCFVDDGNGDLVNIINAEGCALDRYILNNLEYPTDLTAGQVKQLLFFISAFYFFLTFSDFCCGTVKFS